MKCIRSRVMLFLLPVALLVGLGMLVSGVLSAEASPTVNLIQNGDFAAGATAWDLNLNGSGAATFDTSGGAGCINISNGSDQSWHVQLQQFNLNLTQDDSYKIEFDVSADRSFDFNFKTGQSVVPYGDYTNQSATATVTATTVVHTYTQSADDAAALIQFQVGGSGTGTICFDNVVLEKFTAPLNRDIVKNGDFDDGVSSWQPFENNGGEIAIEVIGGELAIDVVQTGTNQYDVMLWQLYLPVVKEYQYSLRFDARADISNGATRSLFAKVGQDPAPYATYGSGNVLLTNTMQPFQIDFTMNEESDGCGKIEFHLGQAIGLIYLDNVQLLTNAPVNFDTGGTTYTSPQHTAKRCDSWLTMPVS